MNHWVRLVSSNFLNTSFVVRLKMKVSLVLLCVAIPSLYRNAVDAAKVKKAIDSTEATTEFDSDGETTSDIIQENLDYVPFEEETLSDGDSDVDSTDDDSDGDSDDDDDHENDPKTKLSKKLKTAKKSGRFRPFKSLKKNKRRITIALALFAFRKEILMILFKLLGRSTSQNITTDVLKLILFVAFVRRMQSDEMAILGGRNSVILNAIDSFMGNDINPAYVPPISQHFAFERLNEYYLKDGMALQKAMRNKQEGLKWPSSSTSSILSHFASSKSNHKNKTTVSTSAVDKDGRTVVVLDWTKLDERISSMNQLSHQVSFLLSEYRSLVMKGEQATNATLDSDNGQACSPALEVVILLESPGGSVAEYGLAGQHLLRLRNEPGITLTICVDKVAASGGYLLCCTASPGRLFAAPFATVGSIGVIATQLNINKLLTNWGVQPLEFRGGKYKAPIGMVGRVSKAGERVTQTMINDVHRAFKQHVVNARPMLKNSIEKIGNGNVWLGVDAVDLGLVDSIKTSDEYIEEIIRDGTQVLKMVQVKKPSGLFFGPRYGNDMETKRSQVNSPKTLLQDDVEGLMQKSKTMLLRLPTQAKSFFSKSLQSFH